MTQKNIALLLETKLQTLGYFLQGNMEPEEVGLMLDNKTSDFIDEVLAGLRRAEVNGGSFESNSLRLDELRMLKVTSDPITPESGATDGQSWFELPDDYRDYIVIKTTVSTDCLTSDVVKKARVIQSDELQDLLDDTYHTTKIESPVSEIEDDLVKVYLNDFTIPNIRIQYIKKPEKFDVVANGGNEYPLADKAIYRIIDKAVVELAPILEKLQQASQAVSASKLY